MTTIVFLLSATARFDNPVTPTAAAPPSNLRTSRLCMLFTLFLPLMRIASTMPHVRQNFMIVRRKSRRSTALEEAICAD
jgi:hypothetical protein